MALPFFQAAGTKVAGDTDFDGNLALGKFLDQFGVLNGRQNVAKTLGTKVERAPDRFRARSFYAAYSGQTRFGIGGRRPSKFG